MSAQLRIPEPITVHCFFGCGEAVASESSTTAHDLMERHYRRAHARHIAAMLVGPEAAEKPKRRARRAQS